MNAMNDIARLKKSSEFFKQAEAYAFTADYFKEGEIEGCTLTLNEEVEDFNLGAYANENGFHIPEILTFLPFFQEQGLQKEWYSFTFYPGYPDFEEQIHLPCAKRRFELIPGILNLDGAELFVICGRNCISAGISGQVSVGACKLDMVAAFSEGETEIYVGAKDGGFPSFLDLAVWLLGTHISPTTIANIRTVSETIFDLSVTNLGFTFSTDKQELVSARIGGMLRLGPFDIRLKASMPQLELWGELNQDVPLSVHTILQSFGLKNGKFFEELYLRTGNYHGNFSLGQHRVELGLSGNLNLGPIHLQKLGLVLSWNSGNQVSWRIGGTLLICGKLGLSVEVCSSSKGLIVKGNLDFGNGEGKEGLWNFLSEELGVGELPEWLTSLNLYHISILYDTAVSRLELDILGGLKVCKGENLLIATHLVMEETGIGKSTYVQSTLCLGYRKFTLSYREGNLSAVYEKEAGEIVSVKKLIQEVSQTMAAFVSDFNIICKRIECSIDLKGENQGAAFSVLFGYFDLTALPVVGPALPEGCGFKELEFRFDTRTGIEISGSLCLGELEKKISLSLGSQAEEENKRVRKNNSNAVKGEHNLNMPGDVKTAEDVRTSVGTGEMKKWQEVQKGVGPFYINRLGMSYADGCFFLLLDAKLNMKAMVFGFYGLSIGSRLDCFSPQAGLDGLEITYDVPPVLLSGGIMRIPPGEEILRQYYGNLSLKFSDWNISVIASYLEKKDLGKCFFAFVQLDKKLGGIPAFTIEGLMGGLGIHYALKIPEIDEVDKFPLMQLGGPSKSGIEMLEVLEGKKASAGLQRAWLVPKEGARWLAAGIRFSSFEMVEGKLLLIADFSDSFILTLLGTARLSLPKGKTREESYLYAELRLKAVLNPNAGIFSIQAELTPASFLIDRNCHLMGGFAFCLWFGENEHAGDFVFTVGGYHPAFCPPSHYPSVNRVGFCWNVSGSVTISGQAYLALTPSCIMAGGQLEAVYEHSFIKAWFTASANLLISWNPFAFQADIAVEIGVSAKLNLLFTHITLTIRLGASLELWGPPTGGKVKIHLWFITFTVSFGNQCGRGIDDRPLNWTQFLELLPSEHEVIRIQAVDGLKATEDNQEKKEDSKTSRDSEDGWVVASRYFRFLVESAVPISKISSSGEELASYDTIDIRPMNLIGVHSELMITIIHEKGNTLHLKEDGWQISEKIGTLPASLWGKPLSLGGTFRLREDHPSADVVQGQRTGIYVQVPAASMGKRVDVGNISSLMLSAGHRFCPLSEKEKGDFYPFMQGETGMLEKMGVEETDQRRKQLLSDFCEVTGPLTGRYDNMERMAAAREQLFTEAPQKIMKWNEDDE